MRYRYKRVNIQLGPAPAVGESEVFILVLFKGLTRFSTPVPSLGTFNLLKRNLFKKCGSGSRLRPEKNRLRLPAPAPQHWLKLFLCCFFLALLFRYKRKQIFYETCPPLFVDPDLHK